MAGIWWYISFAHSIKITITAANVLENNSITFEIGIVMMLISTCPSLDKLVKIGWYPFGFLMSIIRSYLLLILTVSRNRLMSICVRFYFGITWIIWSVCNGREYTELWQISVDNKIPNMFAFHGYPPSFGLKPKTHRSLMAYATWIGKKRAPKKKHPHRHRSQCLFVFVFQTHFMPFRTAVAFLAFHFDFIRSVFSASEMYLLVLSWLFSNEWFGIEHIFNHPLHTANTNTCTHSLSVPPFRWEANTQTLALLPQSSKMQTVHCAILLNFKHTFSVSSVIPQYTTTYRLIGISPNTNKWRLTGWSNNSNHSIGLDWIQ